MLAAGAQRAWAVPTTFAQFHQSATNINVNVFGYLNNGAKSDAELVSYPSGVSGGALPVVFNYLSVAGSLPADLSGNQDATLTLTSSTLTAAQTAFGGLVGQQDITGLGLLANELKITRTTPALEGTGSNTNLLTMTFTGQIIGAIGGGSPQLSGDTALLMTVTYTSDFLTFGNGERQFSLTFTSWGNTPVTNGLQVAAPYFANATANGTGTFAAEATAIPEPGTIILGAVGLSALVAVGYRRRLRRR